LIQLDPDQNKKSLSFFSFIKCGNESSLNSGNSDATKDSMSSNQSSSDMESSYEIYPEISFKIEELIYEIKNYFEGVESPNDEAEENLIKEAHHIEEEIIHNSMGNDEWVFLKICKNK
jgi:hypothetical protein